MVKPRENRVPIMMSEEELNAIDEWRFRHRIATRSDAIRRLCQNAIGLNEEVANLMDQIANLDAEAEERWREDRRVMLQVNGRPAQGDPPYDWTAVELADRALSWTSEHSERLHLHYLDVLQLNNRVAAMSNAPHLKGGKLAVKRDLSSIARERDDIWRRREEGEENRRLMNFVLGLDEFNKMKLDEMPEGEAEAYISAKLEEVLRLSQRLVVLTEEEQARSLAEEPADDVLAEVVAARVLAAPGHDVEWHLQRIMALFDGKANPLKARDLIQAAIADGTEGSPPQR